ncbi:MAG: MFS transporter [Candidatus Omnitrophica bacterium]|nr:MFS transporter [Candidatus Omnitrophota bacterium]
MDTKVPQKTPSSPYAKSLDISWKEGIPAMAMISITDYYFIPLALFLGASMHQIGFLVAFPHFLASAIQLFAVRLVNLLGSRLRFLVHGALLQGLLFIPIALLPLVPFSHRIELFIFLVVLFRMSGNLIGTVWGSLTSDYLSPEERGKYFGWRAGVTGIAGIFGTVFGGILLYVLKPVSESLSFLVLFSITGAMRLISARLMSKMQDIPLKGHREDDFTFIQFLRRFRESNFVKFVFFVSSVTFATNLAAPFFSVYMLRDLKQSYLLYMLVHLAAVTSSLIAFPVWGRHADVVGNVKVLRITGLIIPIIPLLWLFSTHFAFLICVEFIAGFAWGGFNLCSVNFIYDAVSPEKRVRCLSYFNLINGLAIFLGATLGGYLADRLPPLAGYPLRTLFAISGLSRFFSYLLLFGKFQEVRAPKQGGPKK